MSDYTVKNNNAPYFYWNGSTTKARQGNLYVGKKLSGSVSGKYLVISYRILGMEDRDPPYAMYLTDLNPVAVDPTPEPPPSNFTPPDKLQTHESDGNWYEYQLVGKVEG